MDRRRCGTVHRRQRSVRAHDCLGRRGGAIVAWYDHRSGTEYDIYAQHVLGSGTVDGTWPADGVALCTAANDQLTPTSVTRTAREVPSSPGMTPATVPTGTSTPSACWPRGPWTAQWRRGWRALCTAANQQAATHDRRGRRGGAIVSWYDARNGPNDIYAQRVNAAGTPLWTANGVALCNAINHQSTPRIAADGAGARSSPGRTSAPALPTSHAQRLNAAGAPQWIADGVALCTAPGAQANATIVSDGAGARSSPGRTTAAATSTSTRSASRGVLEVNAVQPATGGNAAQQ